MEKNELYSVINKIKELLPKIHPLPWYHSANIPFYVSLEKPRTSLSKHDSDRPSYWHYDDGIYAAYAMNVVPALIEEIERLNTLLEQHQ